MNLRGFLKQTVEHRAKIGEDDWMISEYSPPLDEPANVLPARIEEKQKLVRNANGSEVLATTRVMLVDEVALGDLINGQEVQARESIVDVGGVTLGWTAFL